MDKREITTGCSDLATEILSYMARNPNASDTLEGIVEWWLLEHRIRRRTALVQEALVELVERRLVTHSIISGRRRYQLNPDRLDEVLRLYDRLEDSAP